MSDCVWVVDYLIFFSWNAQNAMEMCVIYDHCVLQPHILYSSKTVCVKTNLCFATICYQQRELLEPMGGRKWRVELTVTIRFRPSAVAVAVPVASAYEMANLLQNHLFGVIFLIHILVMVKAGKILYHWEFWFWVK